MKILASLIIVVSSILHSNCKIESGWMGINVLETSRADVEKRLGKPTEEDGGLIRYETDDALFRFYFTEESCSNPQKLTGGFRAEKGIVIDYSVTPKKQRRLDDLEWDRKRYVRKENFHQHGIVSYWNDRDGLNFETTLLDDGKTEILRTIYFQRSPEQVAKFSCRSSEKISNKIENGGLLVAATRDRGP